MVQRKLEKDKKADGCSKGHAKGSSDVHGKVLNLKGSLENDGEGVRRRMTRRNARWKSNLRRTGCLFREGAFKGHSRLHIAMVVFSQGEYGV